MRPPENKAKPPPKGIIGLGVDGDDGHIRLTKTENFQLVGGSEETHEIMSETAIKFNEDLKRSGKKLADCENQEIQDMICRAIDATGKA